MEPFQLPEIRDESQLMRLANQFEQAAAAEYDRLSELMSKNGNSETADLFGRLAEEERGHQAAIEKYYPQSSLLAPTEWSAPVELVRQLVARAARDEDKALDPHLASPYAAICFALHNEHFAFNLFLQLAANAETEEVRILAEKFAKEEIRHMAQLRLARLQASKEIRQYRESMGWWRSPGSLENSDDLRAQVQLMEGYACTYFRNLAEQLEQSAPDSCRKALADLAERCEKLAAGEQSSLPEQETGFVNSSPDAILTAALRYTDQMMEFLNLAAEETASDDIFQELIPAMLRFSDRMTFIRVELEAVS